MQVEAIRALIHEVTGARMYAFFQEPEGSGPKKRGLFQRIVGLFTMWQYSGKPGAQPPAPLHQVIAVGRAILHVRLRRRVPTSCTVASLQCCTNGSRAFGPYTLPCAGRS